jgi:DnaD/phage-associated family protein
MNNGYVKIHRKLLSNPIVMKDCEHLAIWVYLLLHATHKEMNVIFNGKKIMLKSGQLITGARAIANDLEINKDKVQRVLNEFKTDTQIDTLASPKGRLITILNWEKYQNCDTHTDTQLIHNCDTTDTQLIHNNNDKNVNNVRNIYSTSTNKEINNSEQIEKENLFEYVERMFRRTLNPAEYEVINSWKDDVLTRYAIKEAVLNNACSVKYIERILERYRQNNFQSVGDVLEDKKLKEEKELTEEEKEILNFDWLG